MFSKSKKPENKDMVVAPVPLPPKDPDPNSSIKEPTGVATDDKVFTKVPTLMRHSSQIVSLSMVKNRVKNALTLNQISVLYAQRMLGVVELPQQVNVSRHVLTKRDLQLC